MTVRQVESELGVPSRTIARWLKAAGVKMRKVGQKAKHSQMERYEWLVDQYVTQDKSAELIAAEQKVSPHTVRQMLKRAGIQVRKTSQGRKFPDVGKAHAEWLRGRFVGDKNPNWRGGKIDPNIRLRTSFKSKEWSKAVRARDGQCVECGSQKRLHAHHVKPWKTHPELRFDVSNGITLCCWCHEKAHGFKFRPWVMEQAPRAQSTPQG